MPITHIREVLVGEGIYDQPGSNSYAILEKRINLPEGKAYRIKNVQMFDDLGGLTVSSSPVGPAVESAHGRQVYVTPYPITLTDNRWGTLDVIQNTILEKSGPFAGDSSVLYKHQIQSIATSQGDYVATLSDNVQTVQEFPNPAAHYENMYTWYTNHVYLTCILFSNNAPVDDKVALSFYLELETKNVSSLTSTMGCYKELLEAQCRLLTDTANTIDPTSSAAGRSFPMWKFGGVRPEIMVTSADALRYFNRSATAAYQGMDSIANYRTRYKDAVSMVDYDAAFGDTTLNLPDWITILDVSGITSGIIRPYPPPVKFSGNGNTVMYDAEGLPASVVT